jgi:hypothetical protein
MRPRLIAAENSGSAAANVAPRRERRCERCAEARERILPQSAVRRSVSGFFLLVKELARRER